MQISPGGSQLNYYFGKQKVHVIVSWIHAWIEVKTDLIFLLGMSASKK